MFIVSSMLFLNSLFCNFSKINLFVKQTTSDIALFDGNVFLKFLSSVSNIYAPFLCTYKVDDNILSASWLIALL